MFGPRAELGGSVADRRTELLGNVTLFADVTERLVAGVEMNINQVTDGNSSVLIMPNCTLKSANTGCYRPAPAFDSRTI